MSPPRTVFVVGAGASHDFGFPVGDTLKAQIIEFLSPSPQYDELLHPAILYSLSELRNRGLSEHKLHDHLDWMVRTLILSPSIDAFLEKNSTSVDATSFLGKLAIVSILSNCENKSVLAKNLSKEYWIELAETWLGKMWPLANKGGFENKTENFLPNFSFITFNYDRCIEQFLSQAISQTYKISYEDSVRYVNKISVEHVYGSLGDFFNLQTPHKFGSCVHVTSALPLVSEIKTYSEQVSSNTSDRINNLLKTAERIVFLGFSFAEINRNFLSQFSIKPRDRGHVKIYGTAYSMSVKNKLFAEMWAKQTFISPLESNKPDFGFETAADFFQNNSLLFS